MKTHQTKLSQLSRRSGFVALLLLAGFFAQAQLVITPAVTPACHTSDGAVTFTITGGNLSGTHYYYLYNNTSGGTTYPQQITPTFTGLTVGDYMLYLSGADSGYAYFTVPAQVSLALAVTNTTCPANTGSIVATATGGTAPYTYLWSNSALTPTITNLAGGTYTVTATDASGCSASLDSLVTATSSLVATISNNGIVCNPTLTAASTGGTGAVSYRWNTSEVTTSITGLTYSATYTVTATDGNACTAAASLYVGVSSLQVDSSQVSVVNPTCVANSGSIAVTMTNGTAPYTYLWASGATTSSLSGLAPGQYTVTVTDHNGCTGVGNYYLSPGNQVGAYICGFNNPDCGGSNGSVAVCSYGGTASYTYLWTTGATGTNLSSLIAGTYTVTVTDGNGCTATATRVLKGEIANFEAHITTTPTACDTSLHTGTATAVITQGSALAPFSYTWYNAPLYSYYTTIIGTTPTVTGLSYGSFVNVVVTDAQGCIPGVNIDSAYIDLDPSCYDHITGYAYADLNSNCTRDAGERGLAGINVSASDPNGQTYYGRTDSAGYYDITAYPGTYTVYQSYNPYGYCALACAAQYQDTFNTTGLTSLNNDFGQGGASSSDLGVHMGYLGAAPGAQKEYWVYYYNRGTAAATGAVLNFVHDPNLVLVSTNPPYSSYNSASQTVSWNIDTVTASYWSNAQLVTLIFDIPATLALGTLTSAHADITPLAGDCNPSDNQENFIDTVSGSHDPNAKEVSPSGNLTESDTVLNYTIRFQNTGNAPATRIVIKDTLSSYVNAETVEPGASSHPYDFSLSGNGILTFTFSPIYLLDSVHNVDSSNGFVKYAVHTKRNLPIGTQVRNTAYIYFDINPAVVTNTTVSTRSDFATGIRSVSGSAGMAVTISPNPVQDQAIIHITGATGVVQVSLTDVRGQKVMETTTTTKELAFGVNAFAPGMYLYTAKDALGNTRSGKVLITR